MTRYRFVTVDVFTDRRFGGNPLAVFPDARGLDAAQMQSLAAEFNLSETTFVLPPEDPANDARVRIFNRTAEMAFAGHPNVGTGWVLAREGRARNGRLRFEELAGLVEVRIDGAQVTIDAPQPLSLLGEPPSELVARAAGLTTGDIVTATHPPIAASTGNGFVMVEVSGEALTRARPDLDGFARAVAAFPTLGPRRLPLYLYARDSADRLRARMFAPLSGTLEDAATGSAATALAALLLERGGAAEARLEIVQGVEMGRPSLLFTRAWRTTDGARASVGGGCVAVMSGDVEI